MERTELKNILLKYYALSTVNAILRGDRIPQLKMALLLEQKHNIPAKAWLDIKSYLNSTTLRRSGKELQGAKE